MFVQFPQSGGAWKQMPSLRFSRAGNLSARALPIQRKDPGPLFTFGQPEAQTNIRRRLEPLWKHLSPVFLSACDREQLEADVLSKAVETGAAILERAYDPHLPN